MGSVKEMERAMQVNRSILIAVDDSEASHRAVEYVADMLGRQYKFFVTLFHVLPTLPPSLLEHGGSENPAIEEAKEEEIRNRQASWLEEVKRTAQPTLERAKAVLRDARIPARDIAVQFYAPVSGESLVSDILQAAQKANCETIVVGRETFSGLHRLLKHHVADDLIRRGHHHTIWVVE